MDLQPNDIDRTIEGDIATLVEQLQNIKNRLSNIHDDLHNLLKHKTDRRLYVTLDTYPIYPKQEAAHEIVHVLTVRLMAEKSKLMNEYRVLTGKPQICPRGIPS